MSVNIYQFPPGAVVNIGCGCGDGCGSGGGSGSGSANGGELPPGGTSGNVDYEGFTRLIDVCASVQSIFIDPFLAWVDLVQTGAISLDLIIPVEFIPLIDDVSDGLQALELELQTGTGIQSAVKKRVVSYLSDPVRPFTRQSLRDLFIGEFPGGLANVTALLKPPLPLVLGGAPVYSAFVLWSVSANLNAINSAMLAAKGSGSATSGECADLFNAIGRPIYQPTLPTGGIQILEDAVNNRKYTRVIFRDIPANGDFSGSWQVSGFVGLMESLTWSTNGEGTGTGTAYNPSRNYENDAGAAFNSSGGFGSGSVVIGNAYTQAVGKQGLTDTAKAFDPVTFDAWSGGVPSVDNGGLTYPDTESGVISMSGNWNLNFGADDFTLWIVTTLSGTVNAV